MPVLQRDQPCLEWAQHRYCAAEDQRGPQQQMYPHRRGEPDLDHGGETDDDQAEEQDDKDRRAIAGILGREIETTDLTRFAYAQETSKQPALAAARTPTAEPCTERRHCGKVAGKSVRVGRHEQSAGHAGAAAPLSPPIDADEQEKPDDVDEMPIPGGRLEPEMMVRLEITAPRAKKANRQECRADYHMEAVKAGRHEKGRRVDAAGEAKGRMAVFIGLNRGEAETEKDGQRQTAQQSIAIALD